MSTRGFVGYKKNKKIKGWYNHFDSYPTGLGEEVFEKCLIHNVEELKSFFDRIEFVKDEGAYQAHKGIFEMDWQFDRPVMQDGGDFYKNGLFCEWGYIFDFDHRSLKVYRGFGETPDRGKKDWYHRGGFDGRMFFVNEVADFDFELLKRSNPAELANNLEEMVKIKENKKTSLHS
jgi:hypothetical protein